MDGVTRIYYKSSTSFMGLTKEELNALIKLPKFGAISFNMLERLIIVDFLYENT